jgi:hypothetical protein
LFLRAHVPCPAEQANLFCNIRHIHNQMRLNDKELLILLSFFTDKPGTNGIKS